MQKKPFSVVTAMQVINPENTFNNDYMCSKLNSFKPIYDDGLRKQFCMHSSYENLMK